VEEPLLIVLAVSGAAMVFWHWIHHVVNPSTMSGDKWYVRQMAFTDQPVSPPYCWRPLLPWLARVFGFRLVSYSATFATPFVIYYYVGGGWNGLACALCFIGMPTLFSFNIRNPEYSEGIGQLLFISTLWAMQTGSWAVWPLLLLCSLCRETMTAALGCIAVFWYPLYLIPLAAGSAVAYFSRRESTDNRHPLVEDGAYATVLRWAKEKGSRVVHYAHTVQALRGLTFAVPFMWHAVGGFARLGLVGALGIWLLSIPASGQSRIFAYCFGLLIPFTAALPGEWCWAVAGLCWFWPIDYALYSESGDVKFGFAR